MNPTAGDSWRRLTILDLSVLVAAAACTLAMERLASIGRWAVAVVRLDPGRVLEAAYLRHEFSGANLASRLGHLSNLLWALLMVWTVAVLVLRWLPPRPPWREMMWQPGLWACGAAAGGMFLVVASGNYFGLEVYSVAIPGGVAASWLLLALTRRWRPERSWVDRAGRLVGLGWLALLVVGELLIRVS